MAEAKQDENRVNTMLAVDKDDMSTPVNLKVDPDTGALKVQT